MHSHWSQEGAAILNIKFLDSNTKGLWFYHYLSIIQHSNCWNAWTRVYSHASKGGWAMICINVHLFTILHSLFRWKTAILFTWLKNSMILKMRQLFSLLTHAGQSINLFLWIIITFQIDWPQELSDLLFAPEAAGVAVCSSSLLALTGEERRGNGQPSSSL